MEIGWINELKNTKHSLHYKRMSWSSLLWNRLKWKWFLGQCFTLCIFSILKFVHSTSILTYLNRYVDVESTKCDVFSSKPYLIYPCSKVLFFGSISDFIYALTHAHIRKKKLCCFFLSMFYMILFVYQNRRQNISHHCRHRTTNRSKNKKPCCVCKHIEKNSMKIMWNVFFPCMVYR